jgi:hypothetical protein
MAQRQIVIEFEFPHDERLIPEQSLVNRVRNLGEDLFREFSQNNHAIISIRDVDGAYNRLSLILSSNRHTGSVLRFINKQLVRHRLADIARVTKLPPTSDMGDEKD